MCIKRHLDWSHICFRAGTTRPTHLKHILPQFFNNPKYKLDNNSSQISTLNFYLGFTLYAGLTTFQPLRPVAFQTLPVRHQGWLLGGTLASRASRWCRGHLGARKAEGTGNVDRVQTQQRGHWRHRQPLGAGRCWGWCDDYSSFFRKKLNMAENGWKWMEVGHDILNFLLGMAKNLAGADC